MQLTRAADYAVRVMIHLADLPAGTRQSQAEIAVAVGCPSQFLSKVLQRLTRGGFIISRRGKVGGFELPESRWNTSILEIVEAVEGPILLNTCLDPSQCCEHQRWCAARAVWARAQQAVRNVLQSATIADLAPRLNQRKTLALWN